MLICCQRMHLLPSWSGHHGVVNHDNWCGLAVVCLCKYNSKEASCTVELLLMAGHPVYIGHSPWSPTALICHNIIIGRNAEIRPPLYNGQNFFPSMVVAIEGFHCISVSLCAVSKYYEISVNKV